MPTPPAEVRAFVTNFSSRVNTLQTAVRLSEPYHPSWGGPAPQLHEYSAVWDTGASRSAISKRVAEELGLQPTGQTDQQTANGPREALLYTLNVYLPNGVAFVATEVIDAIMGVDVLVGMDIIGAGDFAVTHRYGHTVMTYQSPSAEHNNFVHNLKQRKDSKGKPPTLVSASVGNRVNIR